MKANELSCKDLMVWDWIKPKNVDANFRVGLLGVSSVWNDTDTHEWDYDEIEPIPLTAEILEKNGFENLDGHYWLNPSYESHINIIFFKGFIELDVRNYHSTLEDENGNYDVSTYDRKYTNVLYVHQLQHALRLCGIEKEIEL